MSEGPDPGLAVLDFVFKSMMIDTEWSVREPRGFTWWAHRFAQRVWAEPARLDAAGEAIRVHAETDLLHKIPSNPQTAERFAVLNRSASLSAFVWDPEKERASLHCSAYVHAENVGWLKYLLAAAVSIQVADAHIKVDGLAKVLGGEPDVSGHPSHGPRKAMDDMLNIIEGLFVPAGRDPSPFTEADFSAALGMKPNPWLLATGGPAGMTAEFSFSDDVPAALGGKGTALFQASAEGSHPQLGSGALLRLTLPVELAADRAALLVGELNAAETREWGRCHLLGAWCTDPTGITFVTFLPAAVHRRGLLEAMVWSMALRARWAKEYLGSVPPDSGI